MSNSFEIASDLLTPEEAAAKLRVSAPFIYLHVSRRVPRPIPSCRVGRSIRISWAALCEWVHQNSAPATGSAESRA